MSEMKNTFGSYDSYLFHEGSHYKAYMKMGAHLRRENGVYGVRFCVWAPNGLRPVRAHRLEQGSRRDGQKRQRHLGMLHPRRQGR